MRNKYLLTVEEFCDINNIEVSFVWSLQQSGLIELITVKETTYFKTDQLQLVEKYMRLYYEMDINLEGIETITHLLQQISKMHNEIVSLRNRLRLYEIE